MQQVLCLGSRDADPPVGLRRSARSCRYANHRCESPFDLERRTEHLSAQARRRNRCGQTLFLRRERIRERPEHGTCVRPSHE
jgi:hypothetical protein